MTQTSIFEVVGNGPATASEQPAGSAEGAEAALAASEEQSPIPHGATWPWTAQSVDDIEWCLREQARAADELAQLEASKAAAVAAINARFEVAAKSLVRDIGYFQGQVETWARANQSQVVRGKTKTRQFLNGSVSFRSKPGKLVVLDAAALEAWLVEQDPSRGLYRTKVEPEKKALAELVKTTGEVPAGCDWESESETVAVKPVQLPTITTTTKKSLP